MLNNLSIISTIKDVDLRPLAEICFCRFCNLILKMALIAMLVFHSAVCPYEQDYIAPICVGL